MTDKAQHARHNMQQMDTSSTAALCSTAETYRHWVITASHCCSRLVTTRRPAALQGD